MAQLARKIEPDFVQAILVGFAVILPAKAEYLLVKLGLDLNDLDNALLDIMANPSNTKDAQGIYFGVIGKTTEGVAIEFDLRFESEQRICNVERMALASGATGDENLENESHLIKAKGAND